MSIKDLNDFIVSYEDTDTDKLYKYSLRLIDLVLMTPMDNKELIFNFAVFHTEEKEFLDLFRGGLTTKDLEQFNKEFELFKEGEQPFFIEEDEGNGH